MNFRVTNGAARYNGAYTVPTSLPTYPKFAAQQNTLLGTFVDGVFGSANVVVTGTNITYSADGLPSGMTINSSTGVISGTPTTSLGYSSYSSTQLITTVTEQDASLNYQTRDFLIAVDNPPVADTNGGNTVFLMHGNGANAANVFSESLGHTIVPYAGNASTTTVFATGGSRPFGGSSLYLNGSSAIQATPFGNEFNLGYNDFTIEFDIYMTTVPSVSYPLGVSTLNSGTPTTGWAFGVLTSTTLAFTYSSSGSSVTNLSFTTNATLVTGTWYNFCAVRKNGILMVYVNGNPLVASQLPSIAPYNGNLLIGTSNNAYLAGSISEIRITNGYARYTGPYQITQAPFANPIYWPTNAAISGLNNNPVNISLVPIEPYGATFSTLAFSGLPTGLSASNGKLIGTLASVSADTSYQVTATATSAFSSTQKTFVFTNYATPVVDNYAANVTCFMQFDGLNNSNATNILYNPSFVERTGNISNVAVVGNPTIITSPPGTGNQYSSAALYLNGSSGLNLTATNTSAFSFGTKDFTIEFNVNFASVASCTFIGSAFSSSTLSWTVNYVSGTGLQFGYSTSGTSFTTVSSSWTPSAATWYQIGVVNKAGSLYLFVNGSQVGSTGTISGTLFTVSTSQIGYTVSSGTAANFINGIYKWSAYYQRIWALHDNLYAG